MICRRYGCLPWELDGGDSTRLLRNIASGNIYDEVRAYRASGGKGGMSPLIAELLQLDYEVSRGRAK